MLERLRILRQAPPRLEPLQLMVIQLDEICGRLRDQQAQGILDSRVLTVSDSWTSIHQAAFLSADIYNDGDPTNLDADGANGEVDLYISLGDNSYNPVEEGKAPLKRRNHLTFDFQARRWDMSGENWDVEGVGRVVPINVSYPTIYARAGAETSAQVRIFWKV